MFAFDIIDGRARNAVPCGRLFYDAERDEWGIQIAEGAGPERGAVPFLLVRRKGGARDRACVGASLGGRARGASGTAEPGRGLEGEWPPGIQRVRPARYWEGGLFAGLFRAARAVSRR